MDSSTASSPEGVTEAGDIGSRKLTNFSALAETLTCSWCNDDLTPPVLQDIRGSLACSDCYNTVLYDVGEVAGPNHNSFGYTRNFAIEKILHGVQVSCKNSSLGCKTMCSFMSRRKHEEEGCEYGAALKCPMPGCNGFIVSMEAKNILSDCEILDDHLKFSHNVDQWVNADVEGRFEFYDPDCDVQVLVEFMSANLFHILHVEHIPLGKQLYLTSLQESPGSTKYELKVWIDGEETYSFKSTPLDSPPKGVGREKFLLIPALDSIKHSLECGIRLMKN